MIFINIYLYQLLINCFCCVWFLSLLIITETNHQNATISLLGVVIWYTSLYWHWLIIGNGGTPFRKVSVIYCNYYYYDSIHLTGFILITFYWVSMISFISNKKLRNIAEEVPSGIPRASSNDENSFRVKPVIERNMCFLIEIERWSCD